MSKVLKYFELNGLAEAIRYILLYTDQKFEDIRYPRSGWPNKEIKDALPFGRLPVLEENGKVLHQSIAITRYVAANTELLPADPWEQAVLDAAVLTVYDFDKHVIDFISAETPEDKEKFRKIFYEESLPFYFTKFEDQLKKNNGHFGGKLNWADFVFVALIECANLFLNDEIEKGYPNISQLMKRIQALPRVKEYVAARKPYDISAWQ